MKSVVNLLTIILLLHLLTDVKGQVKKGSWYSREITINYSDIRNLSLSQLNIVAFTCKDDGSPFKMGRCVIIKNLSKDTLYYRNAPHRSYQSINKATYWTWSPANVLTYYPILPGNKEIICTDLYEDAKSRIQHCNMVAEFKFFVPEALEKAKKALLLKDTSAPLTARYVYFTTDINIKPKESQFSGLMTGKVLTIFSKPVLHTGSTKDLLLAEKEAFVNQIIQQVPAVPDKYKQLQSESNYQAINTYQSKPYSNILLKSEKEVYEAIEAYILDWRKITEGLSLANAKEFYQLK